MQKWQDLWISFRAVLFQEVTANVRPVAVVSFCGGDSGAQEQHADRALCATWPWLLTDSSTFQALFPGFLSLL